MAQRTQGRRPRPWRGAVRKTGGSWRWLALSHKVPRDLNPLFTSSEEPWVLLTALPGPQLIHSPIPTHPTTKRTPCQDSRYIVTICSFPNEFP
jgi:hypothetical protein